MRLKTSAAPVKFTEKELRFLGQNEICRLSTASKNGELHVVPVSYLWHGGFLYVAIDYGTRKLRNLQENPQLALIVDTVRPQRGLMIRGNAQIIEKGEEYRKIYKLFHSKFDWVKRAPWKEGEAPFVKITPLFKTGWGLGR